MQYGHSYAGSIEKHRPHRVHTHTHILYIISISLCVLWDCLLVSNGGSEQRITGITSLSTTLGPLTCVSVGTSRIIMRYFRQKLSYSEADMLDVKGGLFKSLQFQNTFSLLGVNIWVSCTPRYLVTLTLLFSNVPVSVCYYFLGIINVSNRWRTR